MYPDEPKNELALKEEWEASGQSYLQYVLEKIQAELSYKGIAFVQLANSCAEDKTFIHEFVLFSTKNGVVRLDSYGKDQVLRYEDGKVNAYPGYNLYCARMVEWPTWEADLCTLLTTPPGVRRIAYWNGLFSAKEESDTEEDIDVVLYTPKEA